MRERVRPETARMRPAEAGAVGERGSARHHVLVMQRAFGNWATTRLLQRAPRRQSPRSRFWVDDDVDGVEFEAGVRDGDWQTFTIRGRDVTLAYNYRTSSYHAGVDGKKIEASSLRSAALRRRRSASPGPGARPSASSSSSPVGEEETAGIIGWLSTSSNAPSEYPREVAPRLVYHVLPKGGLLGKACIEWALRGMADTPIDPDAFFQWLTGGSGAVEPAWVGGLAGGVAGELRGMLDMVKTHGLNQLFNETVPVESIPTARRYVRRACDVLVQQCGFEIVRSSVAQGWVCCQWQIAAGVVRPEHWWIELHTAQGPLVLQTVTGVNIEVGGSNLRWHNVSSARGRNQDVRLYETYRIPVRVALLLPHLAFLRQAMQAALAPPWRRRRVEKQKDD